MCVTFSAADEYILRHFDKSLTDAHRSIKLLRVCDSERGVHTVSTTVQKYCLMTRDRRQFVLPTRDDIERHDIIVTTLVTSLGLHQLHVKGSFTHIFVDEAAQVELLLQVHIFYLFFRFRSDFALPGNIAGVEVTPLVASSQAYHIQGHHHRPQMSQRPCSSVPVQRPTVHWSASDRHALCQRGPTGSSEVANCNRRPVVQHRWTTSLEHSTCFCS